MEMHERVARLREMVDGGRIIRGGWTEGHDRACLLASLSPEVARAQDASACPASVMPGWLAELTPRIDDHTSAESWPVIVRRYADLAGRWHVLDAAAWERACVRALLAIVREARAHCPADESAVLSAIDGVIAWLEAGAPEDERARVGEVALVASDAAWTAEEASVAAWAASAAALATGAAATATVMAAEAAEAAARAAWAEAAARAEEEAAADTAADAAWDRISALVLDALETEIARAEAA